MKITHHFINSVSLGALVNTIKALESGELKKASWLLTGAFDWSLAPEGYSFWKQEWGHLNAGRKIDPSTYPLLCIFRKVMRDIHDDKRRAA